jgi:hypothetical protein
VSDDQERTTNLTIHLSSNQFYESNIHFDHTKTYRFTASNYPFIPGTTPIVFTNIGSDMTLHNGSTRFTSNDIATMVREGISNYPDSQYPYYLQNVVSDVQTTVYANADTMLSFNSNLNFYTSNLYLTNIEQSSKIVLSNAAYLTSNIYPTSTTLLQNLVASFDLLQAQNTALAGGVPILSSKLAAWQQDFQQVYPESYALLQAYDLFNTYPSLSQSSSLRFQLRSLIARSNYVQVEDAYNSFASVYRKYFELPRTFISAESLANVYLTYSSNFTDIDLQVGSDPYTLNSYGTSNNPLWTDCRSNTTYNITANELANQVLTYHDKLFISKDPEHGVLAKTNPVTYNLFDPWFTNDACAVVMTSNTLSVDIDISVAANSNTLTRPLTILRRPTTVAVAANNVQLSFLSSNIVPLSNINIINDVSTCNAIETYDPARGWYRSKSNITQITDPVITTQPGSGNHFITSNINFVKYTLSNDTPVSTVSYPIVESITESLADPDIDQYSTYYNAFVVTHQSYYPTGFMTALYTASNTRIDFINNRDDTLIYSQDSTVTLSNITNTPITTPTQYGLHYVSNIATCNTNYLINESFFDLSKHFIFNPFSNVYNEFATLSNTAQVVIQNSGVAQTFTQNQLLSNKVKLRPLSISTPSVRLLQEPTDHLEVPRSLNIDSITHKVNLGGFFSTDFSGGLEAVYQPYNIHIVRVDRGAVIHDGAVQTVFRYAQRNNAFYLATGFYHSDFVSYFYTNIGGVIVPLRIHDITLNLVMNPNEQGQDFNIGLSKYPDQTLHMRSSFMTQNAVFKFVNPPSNLPVEISADSRIQFVATSNTTLLYDVYVNGTVFSSSNEYPVTVYDHYAFTLPLDTTNATIMTESIGSDPSRTTLTGRVFQDARGTSDSSNVRVVVSKQPAYGCLWLGGSNVVTDVNLYTLSALKYVSYDPDNIQNDSCELKLTYGGRESPAYPVTLKNYVSRFQNGAKNVATNRVVYPPQRNTGLQARKRFEACFG